MLDTLRRWKKRLLRYADLQFRLVRLDFIHRTSSLLSHLIFIFAGLFLGFAVLLFLGFWIGEWGATAMNSRTAGFGLSIGLYVLLILLLFAFRKPILNGFASQFVRVLTSQSEDEDQEDKPKDPLEEEPIQGIS